MSSLTPKTYVMALTAEEIERRLLSIDNFLPKEIIRQSLVSPAADTVPSTQCVVDALQPIQNSINELGSLAGNDNVSLDSNETTGVLPITKGGTGGSTVSDAQQNLGILTQVEIQTLINDSIPTVQEVWLDTAQVKGTLPISKGGTGATSASDARDNLGVWSTTRSEILRGDTFEALRRTYAEAGLNMVPGSFELGGIITSATDVLLYEADGHAYSWGGAILGNGKPIAQNSSLASTGGVGPTTWIDQSSKSIRSELSEVTGASMVGIGGSRTQADKNAEWVSVTDAPFNVKFDNVTDNTAALNAAFQSGKNVYIPDPGEGNFAEVTGTVYYSSKTVIRGPGKYKPVIKAAASMPGELDLIAPINETYESFSYLRNCIMFDLCVDANGFNREKTVGYVGEWGRGIRIGAIYDSIFVRVNAIGGPQHGIDVACWKDNLVGIGHAGVPVGRPFNIVLSDCDTTDWVYDDGLTTHGCYNILIEDHTSRITDAAKVAHTYTNTQKAIEIDDGSHGVVLNAPRAYGNGTKIMAFSVATHGNAPAAYDVTWNDPWAHGCMTGIGGWADPVTDATYDTPNWRARKIEVNRFVFIKPTLDETNTIFPSRFVDFQNYMDCSVNGVSLYIADDDGSYSAPVSIANMGPAANIDINDVNVYRVPGVPSGVYAFNRDIGWLRTASGSRDIRVDGFSVDNVGYMNRIIGDSGGNALTVCKRINCDEIPSDGQTKTAIFSSAQAEFSDVSVPSGMVPYRIGRSFTAYPQGDYSLNQTQPYKVTIGGYKLFSETLADGTQAKPGILFDNQFYSGTFTAGKGSVAFRTSAAKEAGFSVCAYHDDTNQYVPIVAVWDRGAIRSFEPGVDNTTANGRNTVRWTTGYFATNIIVTSDANEKTPPQSINDAMLDAADDISINVWKWLDAIAKKGDDMARWHFGPIAQQVREAFAKHGLDGCDYGLLCYDKWDDEFVDVVETVVGDNGEVDERKTGEKIQTQWAGDRWGIRPDQCLWLKVAAAERRAQRAEDRLSAMEARLAALEAK